MNKNKKYFISMILLLLTIVSITVLLISNICSIKLFLVGKVILPTSALLFPISYILGDVLAEVYGYKIAKKVIILGFVINFFMVLFFQLSIVLPSAPSWDLQEAYKSILGTTPKMFAASLSAYLIGSLSNAYVLNFIKKITNEKYLWMRTIGSTIVGELLDTLIFCSIAFIGVMPINIVVVTIISQFLWKVSYEVIATPATYLVVKKVKQYENINEKKVK